ncbi:hypothetical protein AALO_G00233540 [Alosa alosa]|uniref:Uncharacterized protein n=1 Tax=Alosa alosa TaxID=278164 RepID=A0AAV6FZ64_9TELE|nr:hypothetical protein AALO_G00233540 [Alosa alosa]
MFMVSRQGNTWALWPFTRNQPSRAADRWERKQDVDRERFRAVMAAGLVAARLKLMLHATDGTIGGVARP